MIYGQGHEETTLVKSVELFFRLFKNLFLWNLAGI